MAALPYYDPRAEDLARKGNKTRASETNRAFAQQNLQMEDGLDPIRLELAFDAQTSGGLLISVAADRADELVQQARGAGALAACVIGTVTQQQQAALILGD